LQSWHCDRLARACKTTSAASPTAALTRPSDRTALGQPSTLGAIATPSLWLAPVHELAAARETVVSPAVILGYVACAALGSVLAGIASADVGAIWAIGDVDKVHLTIRSTQAVRGTPSGTAAASGSSAPGTRSSRSS
jgi:hypothetical protein